MNPTANKANMNVADIIHQFLIDPRDYQIRICNKVIQKFEGTYVNTKTNTLELECNSVMIESPTGSGKTCMGMIIAAWFAQKRGWKVGWCAMRRNLLTQAAKEAASRGFFIDLENIAFISMFDKDPPPVDLLIVDEAQHDAATSMQNIHAKCNPKKVLGLSATPFRTDKLKLCFDSVIKDVGIHRLIQDDYLSKFDHYTINEYTPAIVADALERDLELWGKSLVFFFRMADCLSFQQILKWKGITSEVVSGSSNREEQIRKFENGEIQVLVSMSILTEGFDCPDLETVFVRPSGKSCTIQMAGRVLRKHSSHPVKRIVQCKDTKHPFQRTATPKQQYIRNDHGWDTLTVNKNVNKIAHMARRAAAEVDVKMPTLIVESNKAKKKEAWWDNL